MSRLKIIGNILKIDKFLTFFKEKENLMIVINVIGKRSRRLSMKICGFYIKHTDVSSTLSILDKKVFPMNFLCDEKISFIYICQLHGNYFKEWFPLLSPVNMPVVYSLE